MDAEDDWCYFPEVLTIEYASKTSNLASASLISANNKFGLIAVAKDTVLNIYSTSNFPQSLSPLTFVDLKDFITHVSINPKCSLLAVCTQFSLTLFSMKSIIKGTPRHFPHKLDSPVKSLDWKGSTLGLLTTSGHLTFYLGNQKPQLHKEGIQAFSFLKANENRCVLSKLGKLSLYEMSAWKILGEFQLDSRVISITHIEDLIIAYALSSMNHIFIFDSQLNMISDVSDISLSSNSLSPSLTADLNYTVYFEYFESRKTLVVATSCHNDLEVVMLDPRPILVNFEENIQAKLQLGYVKQEDKSYQAVFHGLGVIRHLREDPENFNIEHTIRCAPMVVSLTCQGHLKVHKFVDLRREYLDDLICFLPSQEEIPEEELEKKEDNKVVEAGKFEMFKPRENFLVAQAPVNFKFFMPEQVAEKKDSLVPGLALPPGQPVVAKVNTENLAKFKQLLSSLTGFNEKIQKIEVLQSKLDYQAYILSLSSIFSQLMEANLTFKILTKEAYNSYINFNKTQPILTAFINDLMNSPDTSFPCLLEENLKTSSFSLVSLKTAVQAHLEPQIALHTNLINNKLKFSDISHKYTEPSNLFNLPYIRFMRLNHLKDSIKDLELKSMILTSLLKAKRPEFFSFFEQEDLTYKDPDDHRDLFKDICRNVVGEAQRVGIGKQVNVKSARLQKSDLKISCEGLWLPQPPSRPKKVGNAKSHLMEEVADIKKQIDSMLAAKDNERLEAEKAAKKESAEKAAKVEVAVNPVEAKESTSVVKTEVSLVGRAPFAQSSVPQSAPLASSSPFAALSANQQKIEGFSNPFGSSSFGQPSSFAAPANFPNMSGLSQKTFGQQGNPLQSFSSISANAAPNSSFPSNPSNPPAAPNLSPAPSSFFMLRK